MTQSTFSSWHVGVIQHARAANYTPRCIQFHSSSDLLLPWFYQGLTTAQGFEQYKTIDRQLYQEWLLALKRQATPYPGLNVTALRKFIKSPSDSFYKRETIIDLAFEMLVTGQDPYGQSIRIFSDGRDDVLKLGVFDYLVNGPAHFIARGTGSTLEVFQEQERRCFSQRADTEKHS